jgi:rubrerythrin
MISSVCDFITKDPPDSAVLSVLFRNYVAASGKMHNPGLETRFRAIAMSLEAVSRADKGKDKKNGDLIAVLQKAQRELKDETAGEFPQAIKACEDKGERGALRALTWGSKVAAIQSSIVGRFLKNPADFAEPNTTIYVCEACGFIYSGDTPPDPCPVCKAPVSRFSVFKGRG